MPQCRTFRYLLQPTARLLQPTAWQRFNLERLLALPCELSNAALEARKGVGKASRRSGGRSRSKVSNQRKNPAHQLSRRLVLDHDLIVVEDLKVSSMLRRPKPRPDDKGGFCADGASAKTGPNRSISDSGWGMCVRISRTKRKTLVPGATGDRIGSRHTSVRCSRCGHIAPENRVSQAEFRCQRCRNVAHDGCQRGLQHIVGW